MRHSCSCWQYAILTEGSSMSDNKVKAILLNPPTAAPSKEILLNLAYLSSTLKQAGHEALILDATAPHKKLSIKNIDDSIREFKPHFIGITLTINFIIDTYDYIKHLKNHNIPIVAGGPHANCLPEEVLQHGANIVVNGEGEETIIELCEHFSSHRNLKEIPGLCFLDEANKLVYTKKRPLINDLDTIPFPDYEPFPIANYSGSNDPNSNPIFWSIFTSRGCPYNCTFCSSHNVFGRSYRSRSPKNVMDELGFLSDKYGTKFFAFQDDEAFIDEKRIIEFCSLVKKHRPDFKFSTRLRIDSLTETMLKEIKLAGFKRLSFGVESFNNETLKKVNKSHTIDKIRAGFSMLAKMNFTVVSFNNIVGFPWENKTHLQSNLNEIGKIPRKIRYFSNVATPIPYPGTKLYLDYHKEYGFTNWWLDPAKNSQTTTPPKNNAFFMDYTRLLIPLYQTDMMWNYSKKMVANIHDFCWNVFSRYLKRHLNYFEYLYIYYLCKLIIFWCIDSPSPITQIPIPCIRANFIERAIVVDIRSYMLSIIGGSRLMIHLF